ncbi:ALP1-like protein [Tanacetum coccineum]
MKCTSAIRQMAYGAVPDSLDEYLQMGATTARDSLRIFCKVIMNLYGEEFLRKTTYTDIENSMLITMKSMGFLGWRAPDVPFVVNNVSYKRGYYLTDGIYPQWSVLIKSIKNPGTNDHKRILYKTKHEAARKDVERAFGVLKQKWKIIKYPARGMTRSGLSDIMYTCLILHNMIIHDNGNAISPEFFLEEQHRDDDPNDSFALN